MKTFPIRPAKMAGVTLIELMVALAIGSVLVLGLVQVFGASRAAYQMSEGLARVQENARFAMDFLQRDIRMAGHFGCVNDQAHYVGIEDGILNHLDILPAAPGQGHPLDFTVTVQAYEANNTSPGNNVTIGSPASGWSTPVPQQISDLDPLPGSDILVLRYLASRGTPVLSVGASSLTIPAGPGANPDGWSILTDEGVDSPTLFGMADCSRVHVFSGSGGPGSINVTAVAPTLAADFGPNPGSQTALFRANSIVYYVAEGTTGVPALHRARFNGGGYVVEELVEGIESLQLLFGRDQVAAIASDTPPTGNITQHSTATPLAASVDEWRRVGLIQVGLLATSPDPAAAPQATSGESTDVRVLGIRYQPGATNDGRYRASYEATIALRNRLFGN